MLASQLAQLEEPTCPGANNGILALPVQLEVLDAWGTCARAGVEVTARECVAGGWLGGHNVGHRVPGGLLLDLPPAQGCCGWQIHIVDDSCASVWQPHVHLLCIFVTLTTNYF